MMIKIRLRTILRLSGLLMVTPFLVHADTETIDGISWTYTITNGEASVSYCNAYSSGTIVIPATLGGCKVTSIGESIFSGRSLTSVMIPDGVKSIGRRAFSYCYQLTSVTIPEGLTSIKSETFSGCTGLTSVTIPQGVSEIGDSAFLGCSSLTSVTIPQSVSEIGERAFYGCGSLTSVTIPEGVTSIERETFSGCSGLTSVTIPQGVLEIGESAFHGCSSLTSVTIPEGVTSIKVAAFFDCSGLTTVTIPSHVTTIDNNAFACCRSLTDVVLPPDLTEIGMGAFLCCGNIQSVEIPAGVSRIPQSAFAECIGLESVMFHDGLSRIGERAFQGCTNLISVTIPGSVETIDNYAFGGLVYEDGGAGVGGSGGTMIGVSSVSFSPGFTPGVVGEVQGIKYTAWPCLSLKSVVFEDGIRRIGDSAFDGCSALKTVHVPRSVESIGDRAFANCGELVSVQVEGQGLKIGKDAFSGHERKVSIYKTQTLVGQSSGSMIVASKYDLNVATNFIQYGGCPKLSTLVLGDGVEEIGDRAFYGCSLLQNLVVPSSVRRIGVSAFGCCYGLQTVYVDGSELAIDSLAFSAQELVEVIERSPSGGGSAMSSVVGPSYTEVRTTSYQGFLGCTNLTRLVLGEGVESIGDCAFAGCLSLTDLEIDSMVKGSKAQAFFRGNAFYGCERIKNVKIPNEILRRFGYGIFPAYDAIERLTITGQGQVVGCYGELVSLKSLKLDEGIAGVGYRAFEQAVVLENVDLPSTLSMIDDYAFYGCGSLANVSFCGDAPDVGEKTFWGVPRDLVFSVAEGSTGWDALFSEDLPTSWQGRRIVHSAEGEKLPSSHGDESYVGAQNVVLTVTNVTVHYVCNSISPEFVLPSSKDTGFVNVITEVTGSNIAVPETWTTNYPSFVAKFGSDFTKAVTMKTGKKDGAGKDMLVWQDYVAGTDPTNPDDLFTASITIVDGKVKISYTPELDDSRKAMRNYVVWGKKHLWDEMWSPVQDGQESEFCFFKVTVEMK